MSSPTEESSAKMNLITQSSNDYDAKRNLVDSQVEVADTLLPYKPPLDKRTSRSFVRIQTQMKINTAVKKREKWLHDGNKWDDITPSRDLLTNIKFMVIDLETHDWKSTAKNRYDTGRMVEIAWKLFSDTGDCLESRQYLVKPYGSYKEIASKATEVHGITTEHASKHGVDVDMVLGEFIDIVKNIPNDGFVIAHNMEHKNILCWQIVSVLASGLYGMLSQRATLILSRY